jgi:hypothetical protein
MVDQFIALIGKGGHIRTVPIPNWVKAALDQWTRATNVTEGKIFLAQSVWNLTPLWRRIKQPLAGISDS